MQKSIQALTAAALLGILSPAFATSSQAQTTADKVPLYGTFHDVPTGFVFVRLPSGWVFVAEDKGPNVHKVFRDGPTGFVFVQLSSGWKFVPAPR